MDKNISAFLSSIALFLVMLLNACGVQMTPTPSATATSTPSPTLTPTLRPSSLTGKVLLVGNTSTPLTTTVELHNMDNFSLVGQGDTNSDGVFNIENLDAGTYELWILITPIKAMVPGCSDVAPPTNEWKVGIKFSDDTAISFPEAFLSRALVFAQVQQANDLEAQGFYAVLEDFKVEPEQENEKVVLLLCKPK